MEYSCTSINICWMDVEWLLTYVFLPQFFVSIITNEMATGSYPLQNIYKLVQWDRRLTECQSNKMLHRLLYFPRVTDLISIAR